MDGLLLVDKPAGITSHDVIDRVRLALGVRKVGHAGTLDPMATGLLLVGLDRATRLLRFLSALDKEYEGMGRLGEVTDTLDADGTVLRRAVVKVAEADLRGVMASLQGEIRQRSPAFSAVKVGGRPLYRAARSGRAVEGPERTVRVEAFDLRSFDGREFEFRVVCSSGTYVRSLIADVGESLGCGAHLVRLVRTRIGPFRIAEAGTPDDPGSPLPPERAVAHLPRVEVNEEEARAAGHGRPLAPAGIGGPYAVFAPGGRLVGIYLDDGAKARPEVVLAPTD